MKKTWIEFKLVGESKSGKTKIWDVITKEFPTKIGQIKWHAPWRKYSFFPESDTIFEEICLNDIANFCKSQKEKSKS